MTDNRLVDLLALKRSLQCTVCAELMSLPFVFECGHTFCYACSFEWLRSHSRSCPTCRHVVHRKPVICYALKELCINFLNSQDLPPAEGRSSRLNQVEQEALFKSHHSAFPDLFRDDSFNLHGGRLEDTEERVLRCVRCQWEVEGPECM